MRRSSTTFAIASAMPAGQAEIAGTAWDYGIDQGFLKPVVDHWLHRYDWRTTEAEVNAIGSFVTEAASQRVHLLHARSDARRAIPVVITHGWTRPVVELVEALPLLRQRFHVHLTFTAALTAFATPTCEPTAFWGLDQRRTTFWAVSQEHTLNPRFSLCSKLFRYSRDPLRVRAVWARGTHCSPRDLGAYWIA